VTTIHTPCSSAHCAVYVGDDANKNSESNTVRQVVVAAATTTTTVTSSINPAALGQAVTFTATVTNGINPTGTVQFKDGADLLGAPVTLSGGVASLSTPGLTVGTHAITAVYSGDAANLGSTSAIVSQLVLPANASGALGIPTLSQWGLLLLVALLTATPLLPPFRRRLHHGTARGSVRDS